MTSVPPHINHTKRDRRPAPGQRPLLPGALAGAALAWFAADLMLKLGGPWMAGLDALAMTALAVAIAWLVWQTRIESARQTGAEHAHEPTDHLYPGRLRVTDGGTGLPRPPIQRPARQAPGRPHSIDGGAFPERRRG